MSVSPTKPRKQRPKPTVLATCDSPPLSDADVPGETTIVSIDPTEADAPRLTLAELVTREADRYARWDTAVGRLLADHLAELAERIRFTQAATAADHEARDELLADWHDTGCC